LAERGALVIATTHLEPLKAFASTHPRARNASVEFDTATLAPTFRLRYDQPGQSYALTIAARLGLGPELIARANAHRSEHAARLADLLATLDANARTEAERANEIERIRAEAAAQLAKARQSAAAAPCGGGAGGGELAVQRRAGPDHRATGGGAGRRGHRPRAPLRAEAGPPAPRPVAAEILLLGQTSDEARDRVEKYLDDAFLAGLPSVRLVHGKGSGALRKTVRDLLAGHPLVESFRDGEPSEGGTGATVAALKVG